MRSCLALLLSISRSISVSTVLMVFVVFDRSWWSIVSVVCLCLLFCSVLFWDAVVVVVILGAAVAVVGGKGGEGVGGGRSRRRRDDMGPRIRRREHGYMYMYMYIYIYIYTIICSQILKWPRKKSVSSTKSPLALLWSALLDAKIRNKSKNTGKNQEQKEKGKERENAIHDKSPSRFGTLCKTSTSTSTPPLPHNLNPEHTRPIRPINNAPSKSETAPSSSPPPYTPREYPSPPWSAHRNKPPHPHPSSHRHRE